MFRSILLIALLFRLAVCYSQSINGVIVDSKTQHPIPYAHIFTIRGQNGTISNANGEFTLNNISPTDSLITSHIGYATRIAGIQENLIDSTIFLYLNEDEIILDEVLIKNTDISESLDIIRAQLKSSTKSYSKAFYGQITLNPQVKTKKEPE